MTCDTCQRPMNYAFYINDEHWRKVVGEGQFSQNVGRVCAHCVLEKLGGASWYIVWNEPVENIKRQQLENNSSGIDERSERPANDQEP